ARGGPGVGSRARAVSDRWDRAVRVPGPPRLTGLTIGSVGQVLPLQMRVAAVWQVTAARRDVLGDDRPAVLAVDHHRPARGRVPALLGPHAAALALTDPGPPAASDPGVPY